MNNTLADKLISSIELYDSLNHRISKMEKDEWIVDEVFRTLTFNTKVEAGFYYLVFKGKKRRSFALEKFKNFETQVFLDLKKSFDFSSFKMLISCENYEHEKPSERISFHLALEQLQNRNFDVSKQTLKNLAYSKWDQPMYGIVVSYLYLLSKNKEEDALFKSVVQNLTQNILDSAFSSDLRMIKILSKMKFEGSSLTADDKLLQDPFETPPMLRVGLEKLYELSNNYPKLIPENSINDLISDRLCYDTPWTSFYPYKSLRIFEKQEVGGGGRNVLFGFLVDNLKNKLVGSQNWIQIFLPNLIDIIHRSAKFSENKTRSISIQEVSFEMNLPVVTVRRKVKELKKILSKKPKLLEFALAQISTRLNIELNKEELFQFLNNLELDETALNQ